MPSNDATSAAAQAGYPSRDPGLDALPGFISPPPGYGEVPFWWWTGEPLDPERLVWQLEQLHQKGISGVQVNYAHEDTPGWPTYAAEPPLFSDAWWRIWGIVAGECRRRGMGIGLSTYTLDWPGAENLFRRLFYAHAELNALQLESLPFRRLIGGERFELEVTGDLVAARAYRIEGERLAAHSVNLMSERRDGRIAWTAFDGPWEVWAVRVRRQPDTLNPLRPGIGARVIRDFYQRFQDAMPDGSHAGLNYFFNDELRVGADTHAWADDFAEEFRRRKGYDLLETLPALWRDIGEQTPKIRMDYADVRMALMEERYFQPIYDWHASRGLIFACDSAGRGLRPDEFGDYFRATRWYTAPGHDTPGGQADLIKGKVSSSIASLYRRPRVWLEGYHSLGWGATPEQLMFATRENYLYGCTLLNLHGLYYTTFGGFWEWAPPCYHFRMPYWDHMGVFLKYFERLSYLMSQGTMVCDVALLYPVAPFEAGLDGERATRVAFDTARALMAAGINFEFIDAESLARAAVRDGRLEAAVRDGRLEAADSRYRALLFPAMEAVRWSSLEQAAAFTRGGGLVLAIGELPAASDRAGRSDPELAALVDELFPEDRRLAGPAEVVKRLQQALEPDTRADSPVRSLHRRIGPREVYYVMDAAPGAAVEFRAKGRAELWNPWSGAASPVRVLSESAATTTIEMPLEAYEAQVIVFTPGQAHVNPPPAPRGTPRIIPLDGDWEFELRPTLDNRYGDFRLPASADPIGPEARILRHSLEGADLPDPATPDLDLSAWERVSCGFGEQFWRLGPLPASAADALEARLAALTRVDPSQPIVVAGREFRWQPYRFSWRIGLDDDPGHQGWHGLKECVSDHFLCLGRREDALNEYRYVAEPEGDCYFLWSSATVERDTSARLIFSAPAADGPVPHASEVLTPAAVYLHGARVAELAVPVALRAGANPLLLRYNHAGRGYFVVRREAAEPAPTARTPLAMRWFDDPLVIRFDVHAAGRPAEWFRFTAPPGLRAMALTVRGAAEAWIDGRPMHAAAPGRFEAPEPAAHAAQIALRILPEPGSAGAAAVPEPIRLECAPGLTPLGDWSKQGALECYSGGAWYRKTIQLTAAQCGGAAVLNLGKVAATAEVRVNGRLAGIRVAPPWRVDLAQWLAPGDNRIEVLVYNTLANHYATIPTRYRGDATSGLIGPVTLELREG